MSIVRIVSLGFLLMLLMCATGWAQGGVITGRITDASGAVLPGVDIALTGPEVMGERTLVTDERGGYRFTLLPPAVYSLKYELPGFKTIVRQGIQITAGFAATINVVMEVSSVEETLTVIGESPVVDLQNASVARTFNATLTRIVPTGHDIGTLLAVAPGIQATLPDVGGSRVNNRGGVRAYGSSEAWVIIGGAIATSIFYDDADAFSEVAVSASAKSAESPTPGMQMDLVVRSGGNDVHGMFYSDWEPLTLQSDNLSDKARSQGLTEGNSRARWINLHGDAGGPFLKDKFWWFWSVRRLNSDNNVIGFYDAKTGKPQVFLTTLSNATLKLSYEFNKNHRFSYTGQGSKKFQPFEFTPNVAQFFDTNSVAIQKNPAWTQAAQLTSILSTRSTLESRFGEFGWQYPRTARPGVDELSRRDLDTRQVRGGYTGDSTGFGVRVPFTDHLHHNHIDGVLALNTAGMPIGNHNIRVGAGYMYELHPLMNYSMKDNVITYWRGGFARPSLIETYDTPVLTVEGDRRQWVFINDVWNATKKLTLNLGFRMDRYQPFLPEQGKPGTGTYQPKVTYPSFKFRSMYAPVPRLSAVYDLFGNGRTAIKISFGQYAPNTSYDGGKLSSLVNPNQLTVKRYNWDGTLPYVPDPKQLVATLSSPNRKLDPNLKIPRVTEYTAAIEQQLMADMGLRVEFVRRFETNKWQVLNTAIPFSAYNIPITFTDPGRDGVTGTGDDRRLTVYSLEPKYVGLRDDLLTNDPAFSGTYTTYEAELNKRFSNKWQLVTGLQLDQYKTWSFGTTSVETDTSGVGQNPNNRIFNNGFNYWHWQYKLLGSYDFPFGINASGVLKLNKGEPYGRTLSTPALTQGAQTLTVERNSTFFVDTIELLDFRLTKNFKMSERFGSVDAMFDLFNVTNSDAVLTRNSATGTRFGYVTDKLPPRIARLGVRWNF